MTTSRAIAAAVTDLIGYGEVLKSDIGEDSAALTVIAENELLGAANSIEAAAHKLLLLKPRRDVKVCVCAVYVVRSSSHVSNLFGCFVCFGVGESDS